MFSALQGIGVTVVEIPASAATATAAVVPVQAELSRGEYQGVVILAAMTSCPLCSWTSSTPRPARLFLSAARKPTANRPLHRLERLTLW